MFCGLAYESFMDVGDNCLGVIQHVAFSRYLNIPEGPHDQIATGRSLYAMIFVRV